MSSATQHYKNTKGDSQVKTAEEMQSCQDLASYAKEYARQRPEMVALWCLGIGFVLGWRLKPW